jgi:hypothetical protein
MKRCPQCQFIYPDEDEFCDFDQAPLEVAADSEIDAATRPVTRPALSELAVAHSNAIANWKARKRLPVAAGAGLILGVVLFAVYYGVTNRVSSVPASMKTENVSVPQSHLPTIATPSPTPLASPSSSPVESPQTVTRPEVVASKGSSSHSTLSTGPVSTSGEGAVKGKPVILLAGGGKLEADEVWRTKDGVWYRKNGVVTLLKKNKVKAILNQ